VLRKSYYEILGVSESFPSEKIGELRKERSRRFHPNGGTEPDGERLAEINEACDVLGDPAKRAEYDKGLAAVRIKAKAREREARVRAARKKRARSAGQARSVREAFQAQGGRRQPSGATGPEVAKRPAAPSQPRPYASQPIKGRWSRLSLGAWVRLSSVTLALSFIWVWLFSMGFETAANPLLYIGPPLFAWFNFFVVGR
jgi:curved DNA-binding protein CbpA